MLTVSPDTLVPDSSKLRIHLRSPYLVRTGIRGIAASI